MKKFFASSTLPLGSKAREEIRLFRWGPNLFRWPCGSKVFVLDRAGAREIIRRFAKQANKLLVDYNHRSVAGISDKPAGWIHQGGLSVRVDGLWAKVEWLPEAKAAIERNEILYFSAVWFSDSKGRIVEIGPPGVTNEPAGVAMMRLTASKNAPIKQDTNTMTIVQLVTLAQDALAQKFPGASLFDLSEADKTLVYDLDGNRFVVGFAVDGEMVSINGEPALWSEPAPADAPTDGTPAQAEGQAASAKAGEVSALLATVATLETALKTEMVDRAIASLRVMPFQRDGLIARPLAEVQKFLASAKSPAHPALERSNVTPPPPQKEAASLHELTMREQLELHLRDPEKYKRLEAASRR